MKQIALVTGGTRGIGKEIVKKFIHHDIFTVYTGRFKNSIEKSTFYQNEKTLGIPLDLSNLNSVHDFLKELKNSEIHPNIIVHNAGYLSLSSKESSKHLQKLFLVNTISPIVVTEELLPNIKKGHIFFFSPPAIFDKKVHYLRPYLQSKFGQTTYMKSLAYELQEKEISVNSLWTKYPLWTDAIRNRKIGKKSECIHPSIISDIIFDIIQTKDPYLFKGNEIMDKEYLESNGKDIQKYLLGEKNESLDSIFLKHLQKTI